MAEQRRDNEKQGKTERSKKSLRIIFIVIFTLFLSACLWKIFYHQSVYKKLAAIEAARAIPDSENAALIYNRLLKDPNASSILSYGPELLDDQSTFNQILNEPWHSSEHPELAAWIKKHQYVTDMLLEAGRLEKCRFPIIIDIMDTSEISRPAPIRQWAFFLSFAANNDLAENRIDSAIAKWRTIIQMEHHLSQQPMIIDQLVAYAVGELASENITRFVIDGNATEQSLRKIEALPLPIQDRWSDLDKQINKVENLREENITEKYGPFDEQEFQPLNKILESIPEPDISIGYKKHIATARGIRILIALRRYKNKSGHWPQSLDDIKSQLTDEVFTDPIKNSTFVYKLTDDGFKFYSKGKNNIDEDGQENFTLDTDSFKRIYQQDDIAFWPLKMPDIEQENNNDEDAYQKEMMELMAL
jgi:hypothetical protein